MRFERGKEEGNQSYGRRNSVRFEKILNFNFFHDDFFLEKQKHYE